MNETKQIKFKKRATALAVASCMTLAPMLANAAGLGKLTVLSGLGQPLRAELDIGATKEELAGMTARLAPQDVFKQAGVDFPTILLDLRFAVEKRANGQAVVKVTSSKPINEPFIDFLIELNWPAGRLVREYTFLLDPPEIAAKQAGASVAEARIVETVRGNGSAEGRASVARQPVRRAPTPKLEAAPAKEIDREGSRLVRSGETLNKIAAETKYEGVTLEQMLVGIFQRNPDAFIGNNANRLKAGAILNIPDPAAVAAVTPTEAKRVYVAQAGDWNAYRQKLAAATAKVPAKEEAAATQSSTGKITAKVEEKSTQVDSAKDQVKVARTDRPGKGDDAKAAETADQIAKDKALKEAQDRIALLEKNVTELQKLLELKNQKMAELQQAPAPKEAPKPLEDAKPAPKVEEPVKPPEVPKTLEPAKAVEAAKPVEADKPAETKPVEPPKPEAAKVEPPKAVVPPPAPAPVEEPGLFDALLEDPLPLVGGGGIVALLAGYFLLKRRRGQGAAMETTAVPMPSSLGPNSVFRMTGGQSVDTGNTPPQTGDFSQTGPGTIDTDEVDPVAEADVYMAYGRDTQAEEILLDALQKDPQRIAIHAKLLEIYANRRSVKQFETLASELYVQTGGVGPEWEKVASLGIGIDPTNPLYSASRRGDMPVAAVLAAGEATRELSFDLPAESPEALGGAAVETPLPAASRVNELDDDIRLESVDEPVADIPVHADESMPSTEDMALDFDLGSQATSPIGDIEPKPEVSDLSFAAAPEETDSNVLDFDLGDDMSVVEKAAEKLSESAMPAELGEPDDAETFDYSLSEEEPALLQQADITSSSPDFSPEGTLVLPGELDATTEDVGQSTWISGEEGTLTAIDGMQSSDDLAIDLDVDEPADLARTVVNAQAGTETLVDADMLDFGSETEEVKLADTVVNTAVADADAMDFDVKLTDSMFLGQPMAPPEFDIGSINLDLAAESPSTTAEPPAAPEIPAPLAEEATPVEQPETVQRDALWEEVNTKLDLAKAYEEMGDMEGARELLQEVVSEGSVDLVAQAQEILDRIGG